MSIATVGFPDAAPINYQDGEVRHFSSEDGFGPEALQRPTRMLACRDNLLRDKLNEVVDWANNREQYVNIPIMATVLPGLAAEVVSNFGIPTGFQARVFSAKVATSGLNGVLRVAWQSGFGAVSGGEVIAVVTSAVGEPTLDTEFRGAGEFIVTLENQGSSKARLVGSLILTLRPLGEIDGALVEATIGVGTPGLRGPEGPNGPKGDKGDTGVTSYGLMWKGPWIATQNYSSSSETRDVVSTDNGGNVSSWVCMANAFGASQRPPLTAASLSSFWQPLATSFAITQGPIGPTGPAGADGSPGLRFRGVWQAGTTDYLVDDIVVTTTALRRTWRCSVNNTTVDPTASSQSSWTELFGSSIGPTYATRGVNFTVMAGSSSTGLAYTGGSGAALTGNNADYGLPGASGGSVTATGNEITIEGASQGSGLGVSILTFGFPVVFTGSIVIKLPTAGSGAGQSRAAWDVGMCSMTAAAHGLQDASSLTANVTPTTTSATTVVVVQPYPVSILRILVDGGVNGQKNAFQITVDALNPVRVQINLTGFVGLT